MAWSTDIAPTHTELNACVECGLCLPHCPTFRLTGDEIASPRGRLNAMSAVASGLMPADEAFAEVMSFCLQCRACEAACPSLVPFGRAMEGARAEVAAGGRNRLRRRVLGRWIASRRAVDAASWGAAAAQRGWSWLVPGRFRPGVRGLRRLGWRRRTVIGRPEHGGDGPLIGFLAGCVMDRWFPKVNEATVALLERAGYRVIVPQQQTCCGALAAHEGAAAEATEMAARNSEVFAPADLLVSNAAGCSAHLADYGNWGAPDTGAKSRDAIVLVAEAIADGRLPRRPPTGGRVAVHDPCHHRHAQRLMDEPRTVLAAAGLDPVDVDPLGMCCGAAGAWSVSHPGESEALGEAKAEEIRRTGCTVVASANPGCEIQLRAYADAGIRIAHPLELYAEAMAAA